MCFEDGLVAHTEVSSLKNFEKEYPCMFNSNATRFIVFINKCMKNYHNDKRDSVWLTLQEVAVLKGDGASYKTIKSLPCLQPCCGTNYKLFGKKKAWHRDDVTEWLSITKTDLPEYAKKWNVSLPPGFIKK